MSDEIDDNDNAFMDLVREMLVMSKKAIEVSIPCVVTKVISRTKVNVRPLIKIVGQDGTAYDRDVIEGVPVFNAGGGDRFISFPVKVGDLGWIDASDRDISLFLQSYANEQPPTNRMHSFSDARFIPDIMTNITVAEEDAAAIVIQNRHGSVKIALDDGQIRIKNEAVSLVVDGSKVTGVAPGGFNLNGFTIDANGAAASPVSVSAPTVAAASSLTVAGKEQKDHAHLPGTYEAGGDAVTGNSGVQT
jgi:hypothetical protein